MSAITRSIQAMDLLARKSPLGVRAVASQLGLPLGSVHRLLLDLEEERSGLGLHALLLEHEAADLGLGVVGERGVGEGEVVQLGRHVEFDKGGDGLFHLFVVSVGSLRSRV